ncbi:MAG TPA: hypothetical protein VIF43_02780 [Patescibacteria group bacterium]|jgi:hypothetical protein
MNKKLKILLIVAAAVCVAGITVLVLSVPDGAKPTPAVLSASPSPTADPLVEQDRRLLTELSTEFAVKYRSFERVDQVYVDSVRPYMTKQAFEDYRSTLRYADRAPFLQPVRSEALDTRVTGSSAEGTATAVVRLRSTDLKTGKVFEQKLKIAWRRFGERWSATEINAIEFGKE